MILRVFYLICLAAYVRLKIIVVYTIFLMH